MAALLNLVRDRLWGGGLAAYKERPAADQRVLAGNLGGATSLTLLSLGQCRREKPGKPDKATLHPSSISLRLSDPKIPKKDYRRKKRDSQ